ncbi:unnamed protein product [Caretta caretta]
MSGISAGITDNDSRDNCVTAAPYEQDLAATIRAVTGCTNASLDSKELKSSSGLTRFRLYCVYSTWRDGSKATPDVNILNYGKEGQNKK